MDDLIEWAPVLVVVLVFLLQFNFFTTPSQLMKMKNEILKEVEDRFLTLSAFREFKENVSDMKGKIDKMYDHIMSIQK